MFWFISGKFVHWTGVSVAATLSYIIVLSLFLLYKRIFKPKVNLFLQLFISCCYFIALWTTLSCTVLFWIIYFVKFEMINHIDDVIPVFMQHITHTFPALLLLAIGKWIHTPYNSSYWKYRSIFMISQMVLLTMYLINMYLIEDHFSYWPYPFMNNLSNQEWFIMIFLGYAFSIFAFEPIIVKYFKYLNNKGYKFKVDKTE